MGPGEGDDDLADDEPPDMDEEDEDGTEEVEASLQWTAQDYAVADYDQKIAYWGLRIGACGSNPDAMDQMIRDMRDWEKSNSPVRVEMRDAVVAWRRKHAS